ncbi:MFS transporter [Ralstonia syzygii]|uniref:Putative nitrite/nitrate transporter transmembrane protein n=1 Tax=Ralstonia syzygii R24 TaxID=907261 RepID=G3ABX7_9RALS|nr:putative nitrite/nitrate transporter transmembrane protein [Ralstonia syzygii R24]
MVSRATQLWQFILLGMFVGLAGGAFSVGTPYVARWFPKGRQGFAMGVFGAGNAGAALNKFVAPVLIAAAGTWTVVPRVYAIAMLVTAPLFWLGSGTDPSHASGRSVSLREQLRVMKDPRVWRYSQYYSVVFGGYVGLSLWMTRYYVAEYGFSIKTAAFLAACFSLPGGVLRAIGGWVADRYGAHRTSWAVMWVCWVAFFLLSYPQTQLTVLSTRGPLAIHIGLTPALFTVLMCVVGTAMAIGKASVFKFIANDFTDNIGAVSGVLMFLPSAGDPGSFAGFLAMFIVLFALTGIGNGSTFRMIPIIFLTQHQRAAQGKGDAAMRQATQDATRESAAVLGFAGAIGAYGGFFIPKSFGTSLELTGIPSVALYCFIGFYGVCMLVTWWVYARRNAPVPC